jgi:hypothetical protein
VAAETFSCKPVEVLQAVRGLRRSRYVATVEAVHQYLQCHPGQLTVKIELGDVGSKSAVASFRNAISKPYPDAFAWRTGVGSLHSKRLMVASLDLATLRPLAKAGSNAFGAKSLGRPLGAVSACLGSLLYSGVASPFHCQCETVCRRPPTSTALTLLSDEGTSNNLPGFAETEPRRQE